MPSVSYTIYRVVRVTASQVFGEDKSGVADVLLRCGAQDANGPKQALMAWFDKISFEEQVKMNGEAKFVVVPTGNHHELQPKVQSAPRLVF